MNSVPGREERVAEVRRRRERLLDRARAHPAEQVQRAAGLVVGARQARAAERLVTVTGEATVSVAPDMAVIRIGVTSQGKTAREASDANARQMTAVLAAIKDAGIAERDVQTSRLSLQPQYDPNKGGTARLLGFQVTNQLTIKIRDIAKEIDWQKQIILWNNLA